MADPEDIEEEEPKKKSRRPMVLGFVLALILGGGGFFAVQSGLILGAPDGPGSDATEYDDLEPLAAVAFVPIDPLTINLGRGSARSYLRFRAELEVEPLAQSEVTALLPRIMDVLNGYLRAVAVSDLEEPTALIKLRAQMLRRVQIVVGEGRVRDLLVMEFVLN